MKPGDTYVIVDNPVSKSITTNEAGKAVTILRVGRGQFVEVQIQGMGPVGRRLVFAQDLIPGGQLEMRL